MPDNILASIELGGYVSLAKFIPLIVFFYLWILLINWVAFDTRAVQANTTQWVSLLTGAGVAAIAVWLLVPIYIVGILIFLITIGTLALVYVMHRNSKVADFEKVLTINHFKGLFSNDDKKMEKASKGFSFITANDNDIDIPKAKTKEGHGFKIACKLLEDAIWRRANLVKLLPAGDNYNVTMTIDGVATKMEPISKEEIEYFIFFIKHLADLDTEEKRKPQKGIFKAKKDDDRSKWEVKTAGSTAGEHVEIQKFEEYELLSPKEMGMDDEQVESFRNLRDVKSGLVIVAGPKKSGVTSMMYSLLKNHDPFLNSIVTLEKSPAGEIESITQNHFSLSDTGTTTFDKRLQSMIRLGPDIIGVGDCEDSATAKVVANNADKKLIYVTISAQNSVDAISKWIKMVGDKELATSNLLGIVSTRLFRLLCEECREAYQPNAEMLKKLNIKPESVKMLYRPGEVEYSRGGKPKLCEKCQGTGFFGRTGVYESIVIDENTRAYIGKAKNAQEIGPVLRKSGMKPLQQQAIKRVAKGDISINEMVRELKASKPAAQKTKKA